ncbi:hypothetical protein [Proteus myxofaciens]|uniref:Lipoprotein n=1 Tax=Proteus myxofaciens ATCC 19692 TaxID=1354337 RepID=A0A198FCY4_9GAMM|nr:hypothetical protein [Proteus myxofaciens]OAT22136.1 hypothetical protein M983_3003 [Proteus myxofaciens ATCC 19692]
MKFKYILGVCLTLVFMLTACDHTEKSSDNLKLAPFGLQWEMNINNFKTQTNYSFNIKDDQSVCPLVILETKKLNNGFNNEGQIYKLLFLPENSKTEINGLIGIEYSFSTENKSLFKITKEDIFKNLNDRYGSSIFDKENNTYKYEDEYSYINLAVDESDKKSYIFLFNYYKPILNPNMDIISKEMTSDCEKERNPL